ncbi:MAG: M13 family metallopeptidase [Lachnospiraceae bacterium]|nr:M13 family metallopeptidase [Lachnospiraceae bacterium]
MNLRKKSKIKRILSAFVCMAMMLPFFGCNENTVAKSGRYAWIDSNIEENQALASTLRLQDDFAAAANAEWLSRETYDPVLGNGSFESAKHLVDSNMRKVLDNEELTGKNLELIRTFDGIYSDWDYRNEIGTEPLKKYLNYIDEISTVDDVKDYMLDNDKNPCAQMLVNITPYLREESRDYYTLVVYRPDFSLGEAAYYRDMDVKGLQTLEKVENIVSYILTDAGYSEKEIKKITKDCFEFETKLADCCEESLYDGYFTEIVSRDEIIERAADYPLKEMIEHYDLDDSKNFCGDYAYLSKVGALISDKNIEGIKAYFKVNLIMKSQLWLSKDIFDYCEKANLDKTNEFAEVDPATPDRYLFYTIDHSGLCSAKDQVYLDHYFDEDVYRDITEIGEMYIDAYKDIIAEKDWLSEDNKKSIYEKLDNITFEVMRPSNVADYGDMTLLSKEEGGNLFDAFCKINRFKLTKYGERTSREYDREFWDIYDPDLSTSTTGASYDSYRNVIFIRIGILGGDLYSPDMTLEEKLGHIGSIMGHELSHAFDSTGVYRDKNGDSNPIIVGDDMSVFSDKADKVTKYYANITPIEGSDSYSEYNTLSKEAIADMGGVKSSLVIGSKQDDFDYDLFFRSYADTWKNLQQKGFVIQAIREDDHPLRYLRVNVSVQQFDEFYDTYDVKPGDNMYLAPEDRIAIW